MMVGCIQSKAANMQMYIGSCKGHANQEPQLSSALMSASHRACVGATTRHSACQLPYRRLRADSLLQERLPLPFVQFACPAASNPKQHVSLHAAHSLTASTA
jgi:hypothetical protein